MPGLVGRLPRWADAGTLPRYSATKKVPKTINERFISSLPPEGRGCQTTYEYT
jgi:hypothetical protein